MVRGKEEHARLQVRGPLTEGCEVRRHQEEHKQTIRDLEVGPG